MSQRFAISAPRIFDGENWHQDAALIIANGILREIVKATDLPQEIAIERLNEGILTPGFVDLQVNGGGGVMLNNDPSLTGISTICAVHAKLGTTALLPTLITDTPEIRDRVIAAGAEAWSRKIPGFAGLHLEGPHLSIARKGAHDPLLIRPMENEDLKTLIAAREKLPTLIVTLAAESVSPVQVGKLAEAGIIVSIGHSDAGTDAVQALLDAGATMFTHLFNAMSQMTGREPGMVGTALHSEKAHIGLIADGVHVHPISIDLALRAKNGPGQVFLISDAMSFAGTDATELVLNGRKIMREGGILRLEDGTLAGADLDLATAVRVMSDQVGIQLGEALRMASVYPAKAVGLKQSGMLQSGSAADFVWLSDDIEPKATWIGGQRVA